MIFPIVRFTNLTKSYRDLVAVNSINLEIHKGEILGFVGPNGAGKTTTMKMLGGLIKPTSGQIEIYSGNDTLVNMKEVPSELYRRFGFLIDIPSFYGQVVPKKILSYYCKLLGLSKKKINVLIDNSLEIVDLTRWKNKKIKEFSKGMVQRLGLAQAIVHDPDILVLDEPQTGLDPAGRIQVRNIIKKLKMLGKTIFLSSHMLYEISEICDRIAIINRGEIIAVDKLINLEQKMTKQEITVELSEPVNSSNIDKILSIMSEKVKVFSGNDNGSPVIYDESIPGFHIYYDGKLTSREKIHKIVSSEMDLPIIGFSKVRTSRLEDLYIELVKNNNFKYEQTTNKVGR